MGGDKKQKETRRQAELQEQKAREEGMRVESQAKEISALTPEEQASIARGFGLEESLAELALSPERQVQFGQAGTQGLVEQLTQQALGQVETQFQRRGMGTSGLQVEAGSRAAVEQALGVSNLVLQQAQQRAHFLGAVTGDITGRGQVARGRQVGGELGGLQLGTQATQAGLARGAQFQQTALATPSSASQIGGIVGTTLGLGLLGGSFSGSNRIGSSSGGGGGGGSSLSGGASSYLTSDSLSNKGGFYSNLLNLSRSK